MAAILVFFFDCIHGYTSHIDRHGDFILGKHQIEPRDICLCTFMYFLYISPFPALIVVTDNYVGVLFVWS